MTNITIWHTTCGTSAHILQSCYIGTRKTLWCQRQCGWTLQWRHNECGGVSNHQRLDCLLKRLFRRRSKKISNLRVTALCEGNPPGTGGCSHLMTSNIWLWLPATRTITYRILLIVFRVCICEYIQLKQWDIITHPCPVFNAGLIYLPVNLNYGWVLTSHVK